MKTVYWRFKGKSSYIHGLKYILFRVKKILLRKECISQEGGNIKI